MTFQLDTYKNVGTPTSFYFPEEVLSGLPCGLFRVTAEEGSQLIPQLRDLLYSAPLKSIEDYEFDVKIHMLMPWQYPCVPNWHCDNVPRDANRRLDYSACHKDEPPMLLWVSNGPHTEFLARPMELERTPKDHGDVAEFIRGMVNVSGDDVAVTRHIPPQQWVEFSRTAPHRGMVSTQHQWRVFVRATHKSTLPVRPKVHPVRRHCQVYLDAGNFAW